MSKDNSANMEKIQEAMKMHAQVAQGGELTHSVPVDFTSSEGRNYKGTVVFGKPTAMDVMKMGGLKSEFLRLGGAKDAQLVDQGIKFLAHVMATLSVVLQKRPEWLADVTKVSDLDLLYHVHDLYEEWESQFRKPVQRAVSDDTETTEGA
jgi:hypothetical protein